MNDFELEEIDDEIYRLQRLRASVRSVAKPKNWTYSPITRLHILWDNVPDQRGRVSLSAVAWIGQDDLFGELLDETELTPALLPDNLTPNVSNMKRYAERAYERGLL